MDPRATRCGVVVFAVQVVPLVANEKESLALMSGQATLRTGRARRVGRRLFSAQGRAAGRDARLTRVYAAPVGVPAPRVRPVAEGVAGPIVQSDAPSVE